MGGAAKRGEADALVDTGCDIAFVIPNRLGAYLPARTRVAHARTVSGERLSSPA